MLNKILIEGTNYLGLYNITKLLLDKNNNLLNNNEYIKKLFEDYCACSNIVMVEYLYQNSLPIICNLDIQYIETLFIKMCSNSNVQLIQW